MSLPFGAVVVALPSSARRFEEIGLVPFTLTSDPTWCVVADHEVLRASA
jgi:hypothetical protein